MSETLVIIDCQRGFISRDNKDPFKQHFRKILDNVAAQCRLAMERNDHIVFVEYDPECFGSTLPELIALTRDYPHKAFLSKNQADGSREIVDYLRQKDIARSTIRICGVYSRQCVRFTLEGMLEWLPRTQFKIVRAGVGETKSDAEYNRESVQMLMNLNTERVSGIGGYIW